MENDPRPARQRTAENTVNAYTQIHQRGLPTGIATGDLNYWPAQNADKMQLPLRALGHGNVNEYRTDQLGVQANHAGGIQVEGHWYCPAMPKELKEATIDHRVSHTIDEDMWKARIARRAPFLSCSSRKRTPTPTAANHSPAPPSASQRL